MGRKKITIQTTSSNNIYTYFLKKILFGLEIGERKLQRYKKKQQTTRVSQGGKGEKGFFFLGGINILHA